MTIEYPVQLNLCLRPIWHKDPPTINIGVDEKIQLVTLEKKQTFHYEFTAVKQSTLIIELLNKTDQDSVPDLGLDKAVVIESVGFFGISDPKFVWTGVYSPDYPEPWATQQRKRGVVLKPQLINHNYMGWNGKWSLTFNVPVFTWIHNVQNLGWIYG